MTKVLGTIGFRKRGDWATNTSYRKDDMVLHDRSTLYCLEDHVSGTVFDSTKWEFLADATGIVEATAGASTAAADATAATEAAVAATEEAVVAARKASENAEKAAEVTAIWGDNFKISASEDKLMAVTDASSQVLLSIDKEGQLGVNNNIVSESGYEVKTAEGGYVYGIVDANGKVLFSIDNEGNVNFKGVPDDVRTSVAEGISDTIRTEENGSDTVFAVIDKNNNVLASINSEGQFIVDKGVVVNGNTAGMLVTEANSDNMLAVLDEKGNVLFSVNKEGSLVANSLDGVLKANMADSEYVFACMDSKGKVIFEVYKDGTFWAKDISTGSVQAKDAKVRNAEITGTFELGFTALTQLAQDLKSNGFLSSGGNGKDWSDSASITIDQPTRAMVNISGISSMPTSKTNDYHAYFECWDMNGNYFKKKVILNAQGNSSMSFVKKNFAADFCEDDWEGDDTTDIKIGNWVSQDSYHFKAFYIDFFKGASMISYKLAEEVENLRSDITNRPWKRAKLNESDITSLAESSAQLSDLNLALDNGARCMPDGFPAWVYLNGEFYGVFVWALKKHRDNYFMDKKTYTEIHLDGTLTNATIWGGSVDWTQFEVRNPKTLYDMDGNKYDGDDPTELIDESSEHYSSSKKDHVNTLITKNAILKLSGYMAEINAIISGGAETADIRAAIEERFDVESLIDYMVTNGATRDTDGFGKNWQWITYDGIKWSVCEYDKDMSFGNHFTGRYTTAAPTSGSWLGTSSGIPTYWAYKYYVDELKQKWTEAVDAGILTYGHITGLFKDWICRVGVTGYEKEYAKWSEAPVFRDNGVNDGWQIRSTYVYGYSTSTTYSKGTYVTSGGKTYKSLISSNLGNDDFTDTDIWEDVTYDETVEYHEGDLVGWGALILAAMKTVQGVLPYEDMGYKNSPTVGGYYDSYWRLCKYVEETLAVMNKAFYIES